MSINAILTASLGQAEETPPNPEHETVSVEALEAVLENSQIVDVEGPLLEEALATAERSETTILALSEVKNAEDSDTVRAMKTIIASNALAPFGYDMESIEETVVSQEGLGEKLKDFSKAIAEMLKKMVANVKEFFDKHISNVGRMKKALEKLQSKAKDAKGNPKEKEVSSSKFTLLGLGKTDLTKILEEYNDVVNDWVANDEINKLGVKYSENLEGFFREHFVITTNEASATIAAYGDGVVKELGMTDAGDGTWIVGLPGDMANLVLEYKANGDELPTLGRFKLGREEVNEDKLELDALDPKGINNMCGRSLLLAETILKKKDSARELEKFTSTVQGRLAKALTPVSDKVAAKLDGGDVNTLLRSLRNVAVNRGKLDQVVMKEAYRALSAGYAYALESYKNLD